MPGLTGRFAGMFCGALIGILPFQLVAADATSVETEIARWERRAKEKPDDVIALAALGHARIRQARETGDLGAYRPAEVALQAALAEFPEDASALAGLAAIRLALHRFSEARDLAEKILQRAPKNGEASLLLADAQLALGNIEAAAKIVNAQADSPAVFSRRAELPRLRGGNDEALRLCLRAADAAEARGESSESVSWYRVRAGETFFRSGKLEAAEEQYRLASERAPQSFAVAEHLAELRGAEEKFPEAIALYQELIARSHRPDMEQALGDLLVFIRKPEQAKTWYDKALAGYLASVERGEVHFIHHLSGFYADVREDGAEAVKWARQDLAMRQSVTAHEGLAWALYRAGDFAESRREIEEALRPGIRDAHIFYHAGLIFSAAGDLERGSALMREADVINPRHNNFHVHR
jgi:tetratricopeptide (TPR) repeat protein